MLVSLTFVSQHDGELVLVLCNFQHLRRDEESLGQDLRDESVGRTGFDDQVLPGTVPYLLALQPQSGVVPETDPLVLQAQLDGRGGGDVDGELGSDRVHGTLELVADVLSRRADDPVTDAGNLVVTGRAEEVDVLLADDVDVFGFGDADRSQHAVQYLRRQLGWRLGAIHDALLVAERVHRSDEDRDSRVPHGGGDPSPLRILQRQTDPVKERRGEGRCLVRVMITICAAAAAASDAPAAAAPVPLPSPRRGSPAYRSGCRRRRTGRFRDECTGAPGAKTAAAAAASTKQSSPLLVAAVRLMLFQCD